ncbi:hypothetical protein B5P43_28990 [Bacillus sp. SRB_336]|nr:hypothetical protein B5P43_28990 [Bacillus sp. SRB_336]
MGLHQLRVARLDGVDATASGRFQVGPLAAELALDPPRSYDAAIAGQVALRDSAGAAQPDRA